MARYACFLRPADADEAVRTHLLKAEPADVHDAGLAATLGRFRYIS